MFWLPVIVETLFVMDDVRMQITQWKEFSMGAEHWKNAFQQVKEQQTAA